MTSVDDESVGRALSRTMVALHKEQFGRGPGSARTYFAGADVLLTIMDDALLPAERALVEMGEPLRVLEARAFFQEATRQLFIDAVQQHVERRVLSFHSTCDPHTATVIEIAVLEPRTGADETAP